MRFIILFLFCILIKISGAQNKDSFAINNNYITLSPVIINKNLDVKGFIKKVQSDTSFYKAFKNLRTIGYTSINDIIMLDNNNLSAASQHSKTMQFRRNNCRFMETISSTTSGDYFKNGKEFNYYTAQLFASLFYTKDSVCNENNIVGNQAFSLNNKSGIEKHKEQLKMLFFNPGKKINGIPFISNKTAIYDEDIINQYDLSIDFEKHNNINCFVFNQKVKPGNESNVVLNEMTTWFNDSTFEIIARKYNLSYGAGLYDFNVNMEVEMTNFKNWIVPSLIKYYGNWKAIFKKRERGIFTVSFFDYE